MAGGDGPVQLVSPSPLAPLFARVSKKASEETISSLFVCENPGLCRPAIRVHKPAPARGRQSECAFAEPGLGPLAVLLSKKSTRMDVCLPVPASGAERVADQSIAINQSINARPHGRTSAHARPASCSVSNLDCACHHVTSQPLRRERRHDSDAIPPVHVCMLMYLDMPPTLPSCLPTIIRYL